MENNEHNQPVIDIDYIDKLLSTYSPEPEKPAPAPEEPEQPAVAEEAVPAQPEAPAQEASATPNKIPLRPILWAAVICLLAGFLLGRLTLPDPGSQPTTPTTLGGNSTEPPLTLPGNGGYVTRPGIAVDYASMSTKQLTDIAIQIPELKVFGSPTISMQLTPAIYEELKAYILKKK